MPELPGPPSYLSDAEREAWLNGAATVAQLQADQWAILAKQYRETAAAASDGDAAGADDDEDEDACPECGADLVASFGGDRCPACGYMPGDDSGAADEETSGTTEPSDSTSEASTR